MVVIVKYPAVYEREPDGRWTVKVPEAKGPIMIRHRATFVAGTP
jgi:hypothetical protein